MFARRTIAAVAAALLGAAALAQGGPDRRVNQDPPGRLQNETSIRVNPAMPGNILIAFNDDPYGGPAMLGLGYAYSFDWGMTWTHQRFPLPPGMLDAFDPITAVEMTGMLYAGGISTAQVPGGASVLAVWSSPDGGITWPQFYQVSLHPTRLNDKPHMTADHTLSGPFADSVYVAWIMDVGVGPFSDIYFSFHRPGAPTFSPPVKICDPPSGLSMGNGPNAAVAPDGTVCVAWLDFDVLLGGQTPGMLTLDRSFDGGVTWGPDTPVRLILTVPNSLSSQTGRCAVARSYPCLAVSPHNPLELYMVYAEDPDGVPGPDEADVFFIRSLDGGFTWSPPLNLSDPAGYPADQFEPWIAVKPDGRIDVAFYDKGRNPGDQLWDVILLSSRNGGKTFGPAWRINDAPYPTPTNYAGTPWMGEYLGLDVDEQFAYVAFTSSISDPVGDIYFDVVKNCDPCDANCDGSIDAFDIEPFIQLLLGVANPCDWCTGDTNGDGVIDAFDIEPFINGLLSP